MIVVMLDSAPRTDRARHRAPVTHAHGAPDSRRRPRPIPERTTATATGRPGPAAASLLDVPPRGPDAVHAPDPATLVWMEECRELLREPGTDAGDMVWLGTLVDGYMLQWHACAPAARWDPTPTTTAAGILVGDAAIAAEPSLRWVVEPDGRLALAQEVRSLAQDVRSLPQDLRSLPQDLRSLPQDLRSPHEVAQAAEGWSVLEHPLDATALLWLAGMPGELARLAETAARRASARRTAHPEPPRRSGALRLLAALTSR